MLSAAATSAIKVAKADGEQPSSASHGHRRQYVNPKSLNLKYSFGGDFTINRRPLYLSCDPPESERCHVATGLRAWDGGIVLAKYLEHYVPALLQALQRPRLSGLELGCGTGVGGLSLALQGHEVLLTDIGDAQQAATQANVERNAAHVAAAGGRVRYQTLDWTRLPDRALFGSWDVVFGADVIWHETLVEPFLQAMRWVASGPGAFEFLLAHKVRDEESVELFEKLAARDGFRIMQKVATEAALPEDGHPEVIVYHLRKQ